MIFQSSEGKVSSRLAGACLLLSILSFSSALYADGEIYKINVDGAIDPITAEFIVQSIDRAEEAKAEFLLVRLQTPGGLGLSMQQIVTRMLNAKVPIVIYVAPSGAKAASAGFFILLSADVAAMAPGTNTGAAHPILSIGGFPIVSEAGKVVIEKITNDAAASLRSIVKRRGRNAEMAEKGVTESKSYTETEALNGGLIDIVAKDEAELLQKLDGRRIRMFSERQATLRTKDVRIVTLEMTTRQKFLTVITNPNIALLLGVAGLLLLYIEFTHPGFIAPGVIGGICFLLSLLGFSFLPINYVGVLLILLAVGLLIAEVKVQGFGVLGLGGLISMVLGALILVDTSKSEVGGVSWGVALGVAIPFAIIFAFLVRLVIKASQVRVFTGEHGMIGEIGTAYTELNPEGKVFVHGEYWNAVAKSPIAQGKKVRVIGIDNLKLHVEEVVEPQA